jgi:excisionase family DNA binding protein
LRFFADVLRQMAKREPMVLVPQKCELTTQEAAAFLNVSRPFVIKEISEGRLNCRMVNSHRRIEFEELVRYQDEQKSNQLAALFMFSEIFDRRQAQLDAIENIATSALRQIYGDEYSLKFETFDEQRKDGANSFKIEIKIISPHEGQDMETGLSCCYRSRYRSYL